jgi:hypothetical protein
VLGESIKAIMINKIRLFVEKKLNRSNERSANAIKNIIASFGIKGVNILVSLSLVPITINYIYEYKKEYYI